MQGPCCVPDCNSECSLNVPHVARLELCSVWEWRMKITIQLEFCFSLPQVKSNLNPNAKEFVPGVKYLNI